MKAILTLSLAMFLTPLSFANVVMSSDSTVSMPAEELQALLAQEGEEASLVNKDMECDDSAISDIEVVEEDAQLNPYASVQPPHRRGVVCEARDRRGLAFRGHGRDPRMAQRDAMMDCRSRSAFPRSCRPTGCRRG